jgi:ATP-dependent DNA ligase
MAGQNLKLQNRSLRMKAISSATAVKTASNRVQLACTSNGKVHLRSRNNKDFALRYPAIAKALEKLPDGTVIDGEVVAFDESGRPSFNTLQNYGTSTAPIFYYAFDLLILAGRDVRFEPLETRRELLREKVLSKLKEPVRYSTRS